MSRSRLIETLECAKRDVGEAERALDAVIACIENADRAEKTTVTDAVQQAFSALREALARVAELERRIADGTENAS